MATWYSVVGSSSYTYLTQSEKEYNALLLANVLKFRGWSDVAIAGVMGNIDHEGIFNPGQCEVDHGVPSGNSDTSYAYGLGLIQWTKPNDAIINPLLQYATLNNKNWYDGDLQAEYIDCADTPSLTFGNWGWISTDEYPISFSRYKSLDSDVAYAAKAWLYNVERPAHPEDSENARAQSAQTWYTFLKANEYVPRLSIGNIYSSPYYTTWDAYYPTYQMPNCTCYAYGRWNELCDYQQSHNLFPTGMGCDWYPQGIAKGFTGGMTPQLGAAACWWYMGYDDGEYVPTGHVAIVEQINYDENGNPVSFVTSNSAWDRDEGWETPKPKAPWFYLNTISMSNLDDPWNSHPEGYFQGFLYNENISPIPPNPPVPPTPPSPVTRRKMPFIFYMKRII